MGLLALLIKELSKLVLIMGGIKSWRGDVGVSSVASLLDGSW